MSRNQDRVVVLLRHGDTNVPKDRIGGRSEGVPLQPLGERRVAAVGAILLPTIAEILRTSPVWRNANGPVDGVEIRDFSSSPADRTRASASCLGLGAPKVDPRINEWLKGHIEGQKRTEVETAGYRAREKAKLWNFRPDADFENPQGETPGQVRQRGLYFLNDRPVYSEEDSVQISLAVTHGYLTSFVVAGALQRDHPLTPRQAVERYLPGYASGHVLVERADQWHFAGSIIAPEVTLSMPAV